MNRQAIFAIIGTLLVGGVVSGCSATMDQGTAEASSASTAMPGGGGSLAFAQLRDKDGNLKGRATARSMGDGVHVTAVLENVAPGTYAIHVHSTGACTPPDFASAGAHWNPDARQHGKDNPAGPHKGDLPNVTIGADGRGTASAHIGAAAMTGANAMLDADGAAIILHSGIDDYRTDPTGNAGGRAACGVFSKGS